MINKKYFLALAGGLTLACLVSFGQESDNQLWTGATMKFRLNKKLRFDLEEQARFNNNISKLNITYTEGGMKYDLNNHISLKGNFRYTYDPYSHNTYRYTGDFDYDWSKKKFPLRLKYRIRFQRNIEAHTLEAASYFRNKFSAGYNLSKPVDPYIEYESYFKLSFINKFTTNRFIIGLEWKISGNIDIDTFYMLEDEFGERNPAIKNVFGIGLSYDLKLY